MDFSAVSFLVGTDVKASRGSKIKDWLLLLLRAMLLALVVLAFTRPALFSFSQARSAGVPRSVAIVIDNSFSMGFDGNFARAKRSAEEVIRSLPDGSFAMVLPLIESGPSSAPVFRGDTQHMLADLGGMSLSYGYADNRRRMEEVANLLKPSPNEEKGVVLITDMQANGWRKGGDSGGGGGGRDFVRSWLSVIDVTAGHRAQPNTAITSVGVNDSGSLLGVDVTLANFSPLPRKGVLITMSLGGEEAKRFVDLEPESQSVVEFHIPKPDAGGEGKEGEWGKRGKESALKVWLAGDELRADDARYAVVAKESPPAVLVVDGDVRESPRLSETFYLTRAVETISEAMPLTVSVEDGGSFLGDDLGGYDAVFLANVGSLNPRAAQRVGEFVRGGGTVAVFLGDRTKGTVYNALLSDILPGEVGKRIDGRRPASLALSPTSGLPQGMSSALKGVKLKRYFQIRPREGADSIITTSDELPFLLHGEAGGGDVFLFGSTADLAWSNFPISTAFLPVVERILSVGALRGPIERSFTVGDVVGIEFGKGGKRGAERREGAARSAVVVSPDGVPHAVYKSEPRFSGTDAPGIYEVKDGGDGGGGGETLYRFAVNVDPRESDLTRAAIRVGRGGESGEEEGGGGSVKVFREVWGYFIWAAFCAFIAESAVGYFKSRARRSI